MNENVCTQERFEGDVKNHTMKVLFDDGVNRHLSFRFEDSSFLWFDVITWRGRLYIGGDCQTFVFARLPDMFEFFRTDRGRINPGYWQEKIADGPDRAETFDFATFKGQVKNFFNAYAKHCERTEEEVEEMREDLCNELAQLEQDAPGAITFLRDYSNEDFNFNDLDCTFGRAWTFQYIWVCRAIVWAIKQYDAYKEQGK